MHNDLKKPCHACPFRKDSARGYVGDDTPQAFIAMTMSDQPMPCHLTINYEDPEWEETYEEDASYCRGALNLFANTCKMSRDSSRPLGTKTCLPIHSSFSNTTRKVRAMPDSEHHVTCIDSDTYRTGARMSVYVSDEWVSPKMSVEQCAMPHAQWRHLVARIEQGIKESQGEATSASPCPQKEPRMKARHSYTFDTLTEHDNGGDLEITVEDVIVFNIGGSQISLTREDWLLLVPKIAKSMKQLPVKDENEEE